VNGKSSQLISIVDDDQSVRESLPDLLKQYGFAALTFSSAEQFLASGYLDRSGCLILDFAMPGMSGRDLKRELSARGHTIPTIFITAQHDEALRQHLLAEGAVACLFKPFSATALLQTLQLVFPGTETPDG
jgi:FixJ family two-component response regulator